MRRLFLAAILAIGGLGLAQERLATSTEVMDTVSYVGNLILPREQTCGRGNRILPVDSSILRAPRGYMAFGGYYSCVLFGVSKAKQEQGALEYTKLMYQYLRSEIPTATALGMVRGTLGGGRYKVYCASVRFPATQIWGFVATNYGMAYPSAIAGAASFPPCGNF